MGIVAFLVLTTPQTSQTRLTSCPKSRAMGPPLRKRSRQGDPNNVLPVSHPVRMSSPARTGLGPIPNPRNLRHVQADPRRSSRPPRCGQLQGDRSEHHASAGAHQPIQRPDVDGWVHTGSHPAWFSPLRRHPRQHSPTAVQVAQEQGSSSLNTPLYVVAGPEYWGDTPAQDERLCRRIRVVLHRLDSPSGASVYTLKAEALEDALRTGRNVVRELQLSSGAWSYQLLFEAPT